MKGNYKNARIYDFKGDEIPFDSLAGEKAMLLTGIGNPDSFSDTASKLGLSIQDSLFFPDHFSYAEKQDRDMIISRFLKSGAGFIITTEKDYVKLKRHSEFEGKIVVVAVRFETDNKGEGVLKTLEDRISERIRHNR
jgi:tetraacyldisaccharide 4'-kinase